MSEQTDVRVEDWNRLQREVARLRILVIIALLAVIALAACHGCARQTHRPDRTRFCVHRAW